MGFFLQLKLQTHEILLAFFEKICVSASFVFVLLNYLDVLIERQFIIILSHYYKKSWKYLMII